MDHLFKMGSLDRVLRLVLGVCFLGSALIFMSGAWQVFFVLVGIVALGTASTGLCPAYIFFNISTKE
nr:DUF2892 domain-containing protein [Oscillochloris trichoides]